MVAVENPSASSCGPRNDVVVNRTEVTKDFSVMIPKNKQEVYMDTQEVFFYNFAFFNLCGSQYERWMNDF